MASKLEIRRQIRSQRDSAEIDGLSASIIARLLMLEAIRDAELWSIYVSAGSEVQTNLLIQHLLDRSAAVAVPRVVGPGEMVMQRIQSFDELKPTASRFLEPAANADAVMRSFDVCICPGIAFTQRGDRLGSGAGFYDRYLAAHQPRLCIGLAFDLQIVDELPSEAHDRPVDLVITETRTFQTDRASR